MQFGRELKQGSGMKADIKEYFWHGPIRTKSHSDAIIKWTGSAFVIFSVVLVLRIFQLLLSGTMEYNKYLVLGTIIFCIEVILFMSVPAYFLVRTRSRIAALSLVLIATLMLGVTSSLYWPELIMGTRMVSFLHSHHDLSLIGPSEFLPRLLLDSLWPVTTISLLVASWRALSATNVLRKLGAGAPPS
jgi:hypothetical protein